MGLAYRSATPKPPGHGGLLLLVALVSLVTAVATNVVIVHFGLLPAAAKAPVIRLVGPAKAAPAKEKTDSTPADPPADDGAAAMQVVNNAATAVLSAIDAIRTAAPNFVGNGAGQHKALNNNFNTLETAANNLLQVTGGDLKTNQKVITAFTSALDASISLANEISNRDSETDDSKQMAVQVSAALGQIKGSLP